jgi:hypothetical protein
MYTLCNTHERTIIESGQPPWPAVQARPRRDDRLPYQVGVDGNRESDAEGSASCAAIDSI